MWNNEGLVRVLSSDFIENNQKISLDTLKDGKYHDKHLKKTFSFLFIRKKKYFSFSRY